MIGFATGMHGILYYVPRIGSLMSQIICSRLQGLCPATKPFNNSYFLISVRGLTHLSKKQKLSVRAKILHG